VLQNRSGFALNSGVTLRIPANSCVLPQFVTRDGAPVAYTYDAALGKVTISTQALNTGANAETTLSVWYPTADFDGDTFVTGEDFDAFVAAFEGGDGTSDFNGDGFVTGEDFDAYVATFEAGC